MTVERFAPLPESVEPPRSRKHRQFMAELELLARARVANFHLEQALIDARLDADHQRHQVYEQRTFELAERLDATVMDSESPLTRVAAQEVLRAWLARGPGYDSRWGH